MDIINTKTVLALGLSGAMSVGSATAKLTTENAHDNSPILSVSSPDLRVTVYDGIATLVGTATSQDEATNAEQEILQVPGVDYVINMITWE